MCTPQGGTSGRVRSRAASAAHPTPTDVPWFVKMAVLRPTTLPALSSSGPPLFPGLMAASLWMPPAMTEPAWGRGEGEGVGVRGAVRAAQGHGLRGICHSTRAPRDECSLTPRTTTSPETYAISHAWQSLGAATLSKSRVSSRRRSGALGQVIGPRTRGGLPRCREHDPGRQQLRAQALAPGARARRAAAGAPRR